MYVKYSGYKYRVSVYFYQFNFYTSFLLIHIKTKGVTFLLLFLLRHTSERVNPKETFMGGWIP